ncbi:hypothetical protein AWM70_06180 [Paenibacillus yonginensis]|uniref:Alpha/beta hydrolase n=1 Tax=Paenibacillus yonginensis TaxID=1462996 RepID=A0A1B1MYH3_9BACL|nr:alpha/beta hydrolase [Paenibacillus yonginensis]ANS74221.1 hypothetical protein AWM70_06180 [Paenibacillus yonginensis]
MNRSIISMPSAWGRNVEHRYYWGGSANRTDGVSKGSTDGAKLAVIFPGKAYPCTMPLLYYAAQSALEHGCDVLELEYGFQSARTAFELEDLNILLYECKHAMDQIKHKYEQMVFVSKSIGTLVAGQIGEMLGQDAVRQLFLTPMDGTLPFIQSSRCTVIYGTGDSVFSPASVKAAGEAERAEVHSFEGADHMLGLGNVQQSLSVLCETCVLYDQFFAGLQ